MAEQAERTARYDPQQHLKPSWSGAAERGGQGRQREAVRDGREGRKGAEERGEKGRQREAERGGREGRKGR